MKTLSPSEKLAELNMEVRALDRKSEAGTLTVTERGTMDLLEERIMHAEAEVRSDRIRARMDSVAHLHPDMNKLNKPEIPALKTAESTKLASMPSMRGSISQERFDHLTFGMNEDLEKKYPWVKPEVWQVPMTDDEHKRFIAGLEELRKNQEAQMQTTSIVREHMKAKAPELYQSLLKSGELDEYVMNPADQICSEVVIQARAIAEHYRYSALLKTDPMKAVGTMNMATVLAKETVYADLLKFPRDDTDENDEPVLYDRKREGFSSDLPGSYVVSGDRGPGNCPRWKGHFIGSSFPDTDMPGERVRGRLRREARDYYPDGRPPLSTDALRALQMLYAMCDYLDDAMADPIGVDLLAVGGSNVWVFGSIGFRISSELNIIAMLENHGERLEEVDTEFNLARPFETIKPYQLMVECLYPALVPDGEPHPPQPLEDCLRDWLAHSAETLLKRDPAFRHLITRTLPTALRLPDPIHKLCLQLRARPRGPELDSSHAHTVIAYQDMLASAAHESPKLMPLMVAFIDAKHPQLYSYDPIRQLKYAILKAGHSEAAWRYVCRYGARLFKVAWMLTPSQPAFEVASRYLAAMEAAGLPPPPPPSVATAWLKAFNMNRLYESGIEIGEDFHLGMNPKILRLAFAEVHRRRHDPKLNEFIPEFLGVCWWSQQSKAKLDKNQIHTGWPWLVNQWKSEQSLQEVLATANSITWPMQLEAMSIGPWEVVPLNSSEALIRESFAMRNCLRDYIVRCAAGVEEYYSVRDRATGKRKACFGFRFDETGSGLLIGVKGFANSKPLWEFHNLANQMQSRVDLTVKPGLKRSSTVTNESVATAPEVAIEPVTTTDVLRCEVNDVASKTYVVMVDDNFHYMGESGRWTFGSFTTLESAILACKRLVDLCLDEYFEPGISAEKLLLQYETFGDDPFIIGTGDGVKFSAWDYAALRCQVITDADGGAR